MAIQRGSGTQRVPDDTALAWALAESARPYLFAEESSSVHIAIAVGEQFAAIDILMSAIARERVHLDAEVLATLTAWLDCYVGQDAEPRLRALLLEIPANGVVADDEATPSEARASTA
jgi:hypothetical protein